jgi:hypothetical protein
MQTVDALFGAGWSLAPAVAHGGGHALVPLFASGQTGSGGQATIAVLVAPCLMVPAIGHGCGRQKIAAEFCPAAVVGHAIGGQLTPVSPDGPLAPAAVL